MKILITGANGYLGQGVTKQLLNNGYEVIATDLKTNLVDKRAKRINCDLFSIEDPYQFFLKPDILLHLAWRDGFIHYSTNHILDISKHYLFLEKMAVSKIHKIAVMGSMHEVGFWEGSISENTPCHPISLYGISKNALRNCLEILANRNGVIWQWLRAYYIVGNSEYGSSIFSKITEATKKGKTVFPFTLGLNQFDFIDYDIFCTQISAAISQDEINGIIEICSGRPEKLSDRVERFIEENNYEIALQYGMFPDRPYDSKAVWGNNSKISKIMDLYEEKNARKSKNSGCNSII